MHFDPLNEVIKCGIATVVTFSGLLVPERVNTTTIKALVNWLELKDMFVISREVKDLLS